MTDVNCPICLEELKDPVSTPCGHLQCETCLYGAIEAGDDATEAPCPTCRAPFTLVHPDLRFVPAKYHKFLVPSVRRIYLDSPDRDEVQRELRAKVALLEQRVENLQKDKARLMDRCEAAITACRKHQEGEQLARLEGEKAKKMNTMIKTQVQDLRMKYDVLKGTLKGVKNKQDIDSSPERSHKHPATKRKSSPSMLDSAIPSSSRLIEDVDRRLILPIPKRPRITTLSSIYVVPPEINTVDNPPPRFKKKREAPSEITAYNAAPPPQAGGSGDVIAFAPPGYHVSVTLDNDGASGPTKVWTVRYGGLVDSDYSV